MTKYNMYVGDEIPTVSVFKVKEDKEWPIYANTRGQTEWYSFDVNAYQNVKQKSLSKELVQSLARIWANINGLNQVAPGKSKELEWYEIEFLNAIGDPSITPEVEELLEWAYNEAKQ